MKTSGFLAAMSSLRIVLVPVIMALIVADDGDLGTAVWIAALLFAFAAVGEPVAVGADGHVHAHGDGDPDPDTAADWLPGLRDEHEGDDQGWMARWLDRSTWDRRVTPNVIKRTGERRTSRGRRR